MLCKKEQKTGLDLFFYDHKLPKLNFNVNSETTNK